MILSRSLLLSGLVLFLTTNIWAQALFVKPVKVLGDPNFIGTAGNPLQYNSNGPNAVEGREMQSPEAIAIDNSSSPPVIYIADTANNRVLSYQFATQQTPGAAADLILGQKDRFSSLPGGSGGGPSTAMRLPTALAVDNSGNLYVSDTGNNRILRYAHPSPQSPGQFPDLIIGQTGFSGTGSNTGGIKATTLSLLPGGSFAGRNGLAIDAAGNLWVADTGNNRVLRFPAALLQAGQNAPAADLVLGQADFTSSLAANARTLKTGLLQPTGVAFDSAGRLLVADRLGRVVVYGAGVVTGAAANRILGIEVSNGANTPDAVTVGSSQGVVESVAVVRSNILVSDNANNRVMVFGPVETWPAESAQFSPTAVQVIGQTGFTAALANAGNSEPDGTVLSAPFDVAGNSSELYVADTGNNRILVFPVGTGGISTSASRVIGQLGVNYRSPNLVEGKEFATVQSSTGLAGSAVLDLSSTPPHLYVADTQNNRILGFADFNSAHAGQKADLVIGQPDLFRTIPNYPSGKASQPNAQGLNGPTGLALDSVGNLYVADTLNSRILRFPAPFSSGVTAQERADRVIGQSDFTSTITDPTQRTMAAPIALAFTKDGFDASLAGSGFLVAADVSQNRVLLFQKPFSNGMSATKVLGQPNFTSGAAGSTASALSAPEGLAVDPSDRVLVADTGNARIQVYAAAGTLPNSSSTPSVALTGSFNQPVSIGMASTGQFWVADPPSNRLLHFASVDQLPVANPPYAADTSHPALSPRSAFVDAWNNLLITDGVSRVLYFAPQVNVLNAANYIVGRPLAPGTIVSLFPALAANVLSTDIATSTTLPLLTVAADTQVFVNGTASALSYVSPSQINLPLSLNLPQGGTADVRVVRQSTGQIYGAAEIALASASPGLFVLGGLQSGPTAALNQDFTINSSTNASPRGQVIQLYGTGQGLVENSPPDGQAPDGLDHTLATPQILLGPTGNSSFVPAGNVQFSGLAPGFVGAWQINFLIPSTAPVGTVPITLIMNSISSINQSNPSQVVTTIFIK